MKRPPNPALARSLVFAAMFVIFSLGVSSASDIYIAQHAAGSASGADCADAYAATFFNTAANWGSGAGQIGPGTTVHLCGTFTGTAGGGMLTAQGSGASGNPITLYFEAGANFTSPYWSPSTGAIDIGGRSYIVINGGTPCGFKPGNGDSDEGTCNGVIQNTANGDHLANQQTSLGIYAQGCNYCEVKNLGIYNIYVHVQNGAFNSQDGTHCIQLNGTDWLLHDNDFHDSGFCVFDNYQNDGTVSIYNNDLYHNEHDVVVAGNAYTLTTGLIYGNHMHDWANWDCPNDACHHDGIHAYNGSGGGVTNMYIYDNIFDGGLGATFNAEIFLEGAMEGTPWTENGTMYIFNNVMTISGAHSAAQLWLGTGNLLANNTVTCSGNTGDITWQITTGNGSTFKNNAEDNCGYFEEWSTGYTVTAPSSDVTKNVYGRCNGYNCWSWNETNTGGANIDVPAFATWQSECACDLSSIYSMTGLKLNSSGQPQAESPVIGEGANLASLCSGNLIALCSDITGAARPSVGAWDEARKRFPRRISAPPIALTFVAH